MCTHTITSSGEDLATRTFEVCCNSTQWQTLLLCMATTKSAVCCLCITDKPNSRDPPTSFHAQAQALEVAALNAYCCGEMLGSTNAGWHIDVHYVKSFHTHIKKCSGICGWAYCYGEMLSPKHLLELFRSFMNTWNLRAKETRSSVYAETVWGCHGN